MHLGNLLSSGVVRTDWEPEMNRNTRPEITAEEHPETQIKIKITYH